MNVALWRAVGAIGSGLAFTLAVGVGPASAHPGEPGETDEQHAAEDLAGVSMEKIERDTRANAVRITKSTGHAPGSRTDEQVVPNERVSTNAASDPGDGGRWGSVTATPVVPIFQAVLPDGKVLMWDSVGDGAAESYPDQSFTRAAVWNPDDDSYRRVDVVGYNIFCSGYVQLADGNVLVAGGNKNQSLEGIVQTHVFDWRTETWSRGPDMRSGRWYPSVAALANGEALINGGGPTTSEVYQTNGSLRALTGFTTVKTRLYPFLVPRPDGRVQLVGPGPSMNAITTSGTGALSAAQARDSIDRDYGSFATYDIGKVLVAGGGAITEDGQSPVPTKTAVIVDVNGSGTTVRPTSSMSVGRRQFNLTILADGSVLATGGESRADSGSVDLDHPVFAAERWDPATERWTVLASASRVRQYHSAATLLPDGRVLTGGGGVCGGCETKGYLEKNLEYFTPPYLFKHDGSGELADRPVIDRAPSSVGYGRQFDLGSSQASSVAKVGMVRLGAATHGEDQGQRYLPLPFTTQGSVVTATAPEAAATAPPGYYMLFVTDRAGVPSVAKIVRLGAASPRAGAAVRSDYDGDGRSDVAVYRPSTGTWYVRSISTTAFGQPGDQPVPGDYGGDGRTDVAVWRPTTGVWDIRGVGKTTLGVKGDQPVPGDYDGDGRTDPAVWRPSSATWLVRGRSPVVWGAPGDVPVPADYDGDGQTDIAVWRPSTGKWLVRGGTTTTWGVSGDDPVPADYNGDHRAEFAVRRPSNGRWYVQKGQATTYGVSSDRPVPADYTGDGRTELAVWRPSTGRWYILGSGGVTWGQSGDLPV